MSEDFPPEWEDCTSINENDYESIGDKTAIRIFSELNKKGGYIWAEYRTKKDIKIGKIILNSFEIFETKWVPGEFSYERKAKLKTLQIDKVKKIKPYEAMSLRAAIPREGTIRRWPSVGNRLFRLVENLPKEISWPILSPSEQETICAEYLRKPSDSQCPTLQRLLLPVGRNLKNIDIYGYASDGKRIFAQVTFYNEESAKEKIQYLKLYNGVKSNLVIFCDCNEVKYKDNVLFIPINVVFNWLKKDKEYLNIVFSDTNKG